MPEFTKEPLSIARVVERLVALERRTSLCDQRISGFRYWDALRMKFYYSLTESLGLYEEPHRYRKPGLMEYLGFLGEDLGSFRKLLRRLPSESRLLVLANPRRKRDARTGKWMHLVTDPVIDRLSVPPLVLEPRMGGAHMKPAWTRNLYYYDVLRYLAGLLMPVIRLFTIPTKREAEKLREIEAEIRTEFGFSYPLRKAALDALSWRRALVPLYRWLLRKAGVRTIVLVCSYGKESWIEACRGLGIRTIELQHGTVTRFHPGYHYPEGTSKRYVPDEFWGFGAYWTRTVAFPSRMRLRPGFGYPFLENALAGLSVTRDPDLLLVVSQGTIGGYLSRLVAEALEYLPASVRIAYKLHPGERLGWREAYPWLAAHPGRVDVVEGDEPALYDLMARARWQLGVSSTALFEGMRLGCRTILADLPSIEYMEDVLASGNAVLVRSAAELPAALESCPEPDGREYFDRDESLFRELDEAGRKEGGIGG